MIQTMCELCIKCLEEHGLSVRPIQTPSVHFAPAEAHTRLSPTEAKLCSAFRSYRGGEGGVSLCVCKAVKRGAEEAASLAAKSALLFPCETSVEDVCAAHLHTEIAFGRRIA
ncbi:hypothetical protein ATANTOWER_031259 [Ataeniobius toweri]|uniref:Uncharacterized protein n=1 Tax=Ataeniobius toweri TaxID=208326 RepID=A0ABU7AIQ8_9TELE|nr:hypothetical protein [Ataeniobius toweri]